MQVITPSWFWSSFLSVNVKSCTSQSSMFYSKAGSCKHMYIIGDN